MTREISCVDCVVGRFKDNLCEEKICKRFSRKGSSADFEKMITNMVKVVRCGECKHKYMKDFDMFCPHMVGILKPNMHCSYGEREGE